MSEEVNGNELVVVEDEKRRVAEEKRLEDLDDLKRQEDKKNRGKINKEAKLSFMTQNFNDAEAERIVTLIAKGLIKNVTIKY